MALLLALMVSLRGYGAGNSLHKLLVLRIDEGNGLVDVFGASGRRRESEQKA